MTVGTRPVDYLWNRLRGDFGKVEIMARETDNRPLATEYVRQLRELIDAEQERGALAVIGVSRATLGRLVGGLPVTPAVAFMVEAKLRERAAGAAS